MGSLPPKEAASRMRKLSKEARDSAISESDNVIDKREFFARKQRQRLLMLQYRKGRPLPPKGAA